MKYTLLSFLLMVSFESFGQDSWTNLPQENQAQEALDQKNYSRAIQLYSKALEIRRDKYPNGLYRCDIDAFKEIVKAIEQLATTYENANDYTTAIKQYEALSAWSKEGIQKFPYQSNPYSEYGLAEIQISRNYQALGQYDKGIAIGQKLINYFQDSRNNKYFKYVASQIIPIAHGRIGEILSDKNQLKASVAQHEKSIDAWRKALGQVKEELVYEKIASQAEFCVNRLKKLKDTTNVIKYGELSLKYYNLLLNMDTEEEDILRGIENIGNILAFHKAGRGAYKEAIEHFQKSLAINEKKFQQSGSAEHMKQLTAVNFYVSGYYESLNNTSASAKHLAIRIEQLIKLQELLPAKDYSYSISRNKYNLAKKYEDLTKYTQALTVLDASIALSPIAIERDPESTKKKEWQWIQEYFRYQLLKEMKNYELAHSSLRRLKDIFIELEALAPGISYSEHIKEAEISQRELAYPEVLQLTAEIDKLDDGKVKFDKLSTLVKLLKKKKRKDKLMRLSYLKHTSELAWTGLMTGNYKASKKALKKATRLKPVDPYLLTNYAPCLLFMGKYKKAEKVYAKYYNAPFKPGKKIIFGFIEDLEAFEEKGVIPTKHRAKVEEIKDQLSAWNMEL